MGAAGPANGADAAPKRGLFARYRAAADLIWRICEGVIVARASLLVVAACWFVMIVPDQTAEAIRVLTDAKNDSFGLNVFGWLLLCGLLGLQILFWGLYCFGQVPDSACAKRRRNWIDQCLFAFSMATPSLAVGVAIWMSDGPLWVSLVFMAVGLVAGVCWAAFPLDRHPPPSLKLAAAIVLVTLAIYIGVGFFFSLPGPLYVTWWLAFLLPVMLVSALSSRFLQFRALTIVLAFALLWSWLDLNDNHEIRHARPGGEAPKRIDAAFEDWLSPRMADANGNGAPFPVFLVAAEGGGLRAAHFTALVLEELRSRYTEFPRHTFLLVGVSGGSVGAAMYAAALHEKLPPATRPDTQAPTDPAPLAAGSVAASVKALRADLLSPLLRRMLGFDLAARSLPNAWLGGLDSWDRARALEDALNEAWRADTGKSLADLRFASLRHGPDSDVPHLVLLTTDVETGHRMAVSHVRMPGGPEPAAGAAPCRKLDSATPPEQAARLWTLSEEAPGVDVPLAAAAIMSARFPMLTPAATLPCDNGRRRFVDGGYFENSGITTVLDAITALRPIAEQKRLRLIVVRIENSRATTNPGTMVGREPEGAYHGFGEIWSPIRAMLGTRQARAELAVASLQRVRAEADAFCDAAAKVPAGQSPARPCVPIDEVVFALRPGNVAIPLGWWLSESARDDMARQLMGCENAQAMGSIGAILASQKRPQAPCEASGTVQAQAVSR